MEYKVLAEVKTAQVAVQQMGTEKLDPNHIKQFVMQLKMSVNNLSSQLSSYENINEALLELERIQTLTQQIVGSIYSGKRKPVVNQQEQLQQVKNPLGVE
ncbi:hypothetical protein CMI37_35590 [Candidatus Pacearchaeota archaeon]|nr:hypothetical protein [Candidatus Pacearchaeota archaeon]|tara:strand:- start:2746 stop:3045 length:300 start_codon:yes stop_codon:yes gene_type:complete